MKLAIVGSRDFNDYDLLLDIMKLHFNFGYLAIVSGGAKGADSLARRYAIAHNLHYLEFPPDWDTYGKGAGFIRNGTIVDRCDMVLAFWDGVSRGTADTIEKAKRAKKPTFIVYF